MERLYLNGRLKDLGSGQQHKVAPGCGGEETVRDQGQHGQPGVVVTSGGEGFHVDSKLTYRVGCPPMDEQDCPTNSTSNANEIQVHKQPAFACTKDMSVQFFFFFFATMMKAVQVNKLINKKDVSTFFHLL